MFWKDISVICQKLLDLGQPSLPMPNWQKTWANYEDLQSDGPIFRLYYCRELQHGEVVSLVSASDGPNRVINL